MLKKPFHQSILAGSVMLATTGTVNAATFEIEHLPQLHNAGNVTVSSDGERTAYTLTQPRDMVAGDEDGSADTHLYVIGKNSKPVAFVTGKGSVSGLSFSADGKTLYFRSKRDDDKHTSLYAISMSGGEAQKQYSYETSIGDYAVSNDGNTLYFVAKPKYDKEDLSKKGFKARAYEEDTRLASLWSVDLSTEDAKPVKVLGDGEVSSFDLSSDGSTIVAAVAPTNLIDDYYMLRDLVVMDVNSSDVKTRIDVPGKLGTFELSDKGDYIAFLGGTDIHDTSDGVLMLADVDKGSFAQLTPDAQQHIVDVDWLGKDLLAVAHRGVESAVVLYAKNGDIKKTYNTPDDIVVRSADVGKGEIRFIADAPDHPREVFELESRKVTQLTNHNAWLSDIELAEQSTFTYKARDGEKVEGLLVTPNGNKPAGGWPLILTVHGGPEAHYSDGWLTGYSTPAQFAAADGYAVFYPNYRGSTGRGVAFAKQHQDDYAGKEFNDLVDGVNALADAGIINKDRVGITGGSYGGYASMWGATALTEHFAAAVAFVGISNQVSKFGTSDIPNEMHLVHSLKWPWEDNWMNLIERSPIFHAGKSKTPTLIMHGEEDTRVHPSQSMELFRAMKVRTETPVRLVFYPGEGHGNRKAAAQYDYALRLMRWMDTYLADGASRQTPMPDFDLGMAERLKSDDEAPTENDDDGSAD
ncbi:S9 family peptidase [Alteromonas oceanisediminis]|uniref:S9 family peptidase n=1 Tax=Alteromonas oceanisediminis TaxID=2836180 RepID=UPI001BDABE1B|nr:S9 family peptidase [Alteromonas oceanisediminis]MBT0586779.1 S9 family peptidase [Alteromonas oceanisediminis]